MPPTTLKEDERTPASDDAAKMKCCRLPWIFLCLVAVAIGFNFRRVMNLHEVGEVVASNRNHGIELERDITYSSQPENSYHSSSHSASYFFDCNHTQSKCKYFQPGKFFRQYFKSSIIGQPNSSNGINNNTTFTRIHDYNRGVKDVGLENANLPALDSFSWWILGAPNSDNAHTHISNAPNAKEDFNHNHPIPLSEKLQNHINLPNNITYVHVHKCGGTSIQGAMYKRVRNLRKMKFQHQTIINGTDTNNNEIQGQQSVLRLQANVHTYKHSFGGGSKEKKRQWDMDRLDHIQSIASIQSTKSYSHTSSPVIFTVVRDPIKRFLSAIQQVMHYNTDFREKCLRETSQIPLVSALSSKRSIEQKRHHSAVKRYSVP